MLTSGARARVAMVALCKGGPATYEQEMECISMRTTEMELEIKQ
jgi:hypothetical protein